MAQISIRFQDFGFILSSLTSHDRDAFHKVLLHTYDSDAMAHALGKVWLKESLKEHESDKIIYEPFTLEAKHSFDTRESAFDNVIYQKDNLAQTCNALQIQS